MFYTRILLALNHVALRGDLANAYQRHRRIESLFPECKRSEAGALFRWEQSTVFVQSVIEPRFDLWPKGYALEIQTKTIDLASRLQVGQSLAFRLLADANKQSTRNENGKSRRFQRDCEELPTWLTDRLTDVAEVVELVTRGDAPLNITRQSQSWKVLPTSFAGQLRLLEPARFMEVVAQGFGRSRAYGCGLMQIARVEVAS
ncbi:MAG: type I-E CRISPR-associated protein Cas6/Cse3/CasE [Bryobacteraceae bacterium]|nr:type I-E CRISPR-associated protein Cas6/Cse3/CasE [Bryobacteraceae bacterium]